MQARLVVDQITRHFGDPETGVSVLCGACLDASPGETVAIVGPSGSGKSTLLHIIGSLDRPTSGRVMLGETEVTSLATQELSAFRAKRVGFVFQDHHLLPQLTAVENAALPSLAVGDSGGMSRARDLLKQVGVSDRAGAFPSRMSGGERQRVAIARALLNGAKLLLCDEPTGNLDRETGLEIVSLFLDLAKQGDVIVVMVTHNLELASRFNRILELRDGVLIPRQQGSPGK
jgi:lipoprotein-releasing system ATP-binding protein